MIDPVRHVISAIGVTATCLLTALAAPLAAQCSHPWPAVPGSMGVEGSISDMVTFDPDGAGPIGERILVAGSFAVAGKSFAENLALYDPIARTWSPFGPGPYPSNLQLAVAANGDLHAAGTFTSIAGVAAANVARWNGIAWSPLGSGVTGSSPYYTVQHLAALPGGGIVVTGSITMAGGTAANGIARWDGSSWSSLGATSLVGTVSFGAVAGLPNGDIWAAAQQSNAPSTFAGVLRFDGTTWSQLSTPVEKPLSLLALPSGDLLAASTSSVAKWNGTTWVLLPGVPMREVWDLEVLPNGLLVATGRLDYSSGQRAAAWDGQNWTPIGDTALLAFAITSVLTSFGNDIFVGGSFRSFGGADVRSVARWNGSTWAATEPGLAAPTHWLATEPNGGIFAGAINGTLDAGLVRRWTGVGWSSIGGGYSQGVSGTPSLSGLFSMPSGRLISTGSAPSNTAASPVVQQWSGSSWTTLATSTFGSVKAAVELPNGDLVVGGQFSQLSATNATNVARFDGTDWVPLGAGLTQVVSALVVSPNGDPIALGSYSVFRWNGSAWAQVGLSMPGTPKTLIVDADGALVVAGDFTGADVLRWNGISWAPVGSGPAGPVQSLVVLPNGDLVAGPFLVTGAAPRALERWHGGTWTSLGGAIDATVWSLAVAANGDLLLAGDFTVADGAVRPRFARVSTSCPASVVALPAGCTNWYSAPVLTTQTLPWIGGICRTTVTALYQEPLVVISTGVQGAAIPLDALLGVSANGCNLLVVPILLDLAAPVAGRVDAQFVVPDSTAMIGSPLLQQAVTLSVTTGGSLFANASNALVFVTGSF